jgi:hypothetical protein
MSSKNKKQNKPKEQQPTQEIKKVDVAPKETPLVTEEYKPSQNADKYPESKELLTAKASIRYKLIFSKNDYVRFQEDVSKHLNEGWNLAGGVCVALNQNSHGVEVVYSQAVVK